MWTTWCNNCPHNPILIWHLQIVSSVHCPKNSLIKNQSCPSWSGCNGLCPAFVYIYLAQKLDKHCAVSVPTVTDLVFMHRDLEWVHIWHSVTIFLFLCLLLYPVLARLKVNFSPKVSEWVSETSLVRELLSGVVPAMRGVYTVLYSRIIYCRWRWLNYST